MCKSPFCGAGAEASFGIAEAPAAGLAEAPVFEAGLAAGLAEAPLFEAELAEALFAGAGGTDNGVGGRVAGVPGTSIEVPDWPTGRSHLTSFLADLAGGSLAACLAFFGVGDDAVAGSFLLRAEGLLVFGFFG